jgi:EpsI family protein
LTRRFALTAAVMLCAAQAASTWVFRRDPYLPSPPKLAALPPELGGWSQLTEEAVEPEVLDMLGPDDYLARIYQSPNRQQQAELFVAYYKTQLRAKNAHDPKVCLPGAGWNPLDSHVAEVSLPGSNRSFPVLYYRIRKGEAEQVVLYWFQMLQGVYTFEQQLRFHSVVDSILQNRTDMALVRVVVPVGAKGLDSAGSSATEIARAAYIDMLPYFSKKTGS